MSEPVPSSPALSFDALTVPLDNEVMLVEASAGTGKTFAITRLVLRLLLERKVESLSRILVVTFTEKATQELVTRIRETLRAAERVWSADPPAREAANEDLFRLRATHAEGGGDIIRIALNSLDDLAVSTIHGFCQRILAESALESGIPFRTTFIQDDTEPFGRAARDWARHRLIRDRETAQVMVDSNEQVERWIRPLIGDFRREPDTHLQFDSASREQSMLADFVTKVNTTFENEKERRHLLGFDDLLVKLSRVLQNEGSNGPMAQRIRDKFGAALIDEFQDTDTTQYEIFSKAFTGCPLFLIGDPKQSIYRFRGADIHAYIKASRSARKYTLLQNFRSTPEYVKAVEMLFTRLPEPFKVSEQEISYPRVSAARAIDAPASLKADGKAAMEWWWLAAPSDTKAKYVSKELALRLLFRDVANEIVRLNGTGLPCKCVAVLVRSNREARLMKQMLDRARVPAVVGADADVMCSEESDELGRIAAAVASPHDARTVSAAMATRLWGSDAGEIAAALREDGESTLLESTDRFLAARTTWRLRGAAASMGELFGHRDSANRMLALPDGERRWTNVRHLVELLHTAWATEGIVPEAVAGWVARERTLANTPDRRELRLETDAEAVQILTVHKAKGLQFDVVFCPTLWDCFDPQSRNGPLGINPALAVENERPVLDLGTPKHALRNLAVAEEEFQESLRLAYVALTRAVHRCYVAWGEIGRSTSAVSALGHLLRPAFDEDKLTALLTLVQNSAGTMALRQVIHNTPASVAQGVAPEQTTPLAASLRLATGQLDSWKVSSFTGLTAGGHVETARDDADFAMVPTVAVVSAPATGFRAFPAGAQAGVALHDIFEKLDFQDTGSARTRDIIRRSLATHALTGDVSVAATRLHDVATMVQTVANAPIPDAGFALRQIPVEASLREWRFDLSVATVSARRIAHVLAEHGSAHAKAYAPLLQSLKDEVVGGYLTGVVDIAFEREGRWWIMDWKSNRLGNSDDDYAADALSAAMMNAHYTLQYHLYLLALHRHLGIRQPGYNAATHWGGVAYVFLRGVTGEGNGGWFRDTPAAALIEALDSALGKRS